MNDDDPVLPADAKPPIRSMSEHVDDVTKLIERAFKSKNDLAGLATGFCDLDGLTGGLQPGALVLLAGRPAMGKSALAAQVARNVSLRGRKRVLYFSPDVPVEDLVLRLLAAEPKLNLDLVRRGLIERHQWPALAGAAGQLSEAPLFIDETPSLRIEHMGPRCRQQLEETGLDLIVVDDPQGLVPFSSERADGARERDVAGLCFALKTLAKELGVPVLCVSDIGTGAERRDDHRPMLGDLHDAGADPEAADVVWLLSRDEYYLREKTPEDRLGIADLFIAKNKRGPTGTVELHFIASQLRFEDYRGELNARSLSVDVEPPPEHDDDDDERVPPLEKPPPENDR